MDLPDRCSVVVIGAGVVGTSVAWHLAQAGCSDVLLLERSKVGSGTTWHAAGNMETWRTDPLIGEMVAYTVRLFPELERDSGVAFGWRQTGRVHFTSDPEVRKSYRAVPARARARGVEVFELDPAGVVEKLPMISPDGLLGGLWTPNDGRVDPTNLAMAYARGATRRGVRLVEDCPVEAILVEDGKVRGVRTKMGEVRADAVVLAGGLWSTRIARSCGIRLPLLGLHHFYLLTETVPGLPRDLPLFLSYDELIYGREDVGGLLLGVFDRNAIGIEPEQLPGDFSFALLDENWDQIAPNLKILEHRFPLLETTGVRTFVNGPESFTPDGNMLLGELDSPRGLHLACGMNSNGIALAAGVGLLTAERVLGRPASFDATRLDPKRFARFQGGRTYRFARMSELPVVACIGEDPASHVRGVRRSTLHHRHEADGAAFEAVAGHERPLWFRCNGSPEAELAAARTGVVRIDSSAEAKLLLTGPNATTHLLGRSGGKGLDQPGSAVWAPLLSVSGKVLGLPLALNLGPETWLLTTDPELQAWLEAAFSEAEGASVGDATAQWAMLDVVGPKAGDLVARLSPSTALPEVGLLVASDLGLAEGFIARLGPERWRLVVTSDMAGHVDDELRRYGQDLGLVPAGHLVADTLRIEAGIPSFTADVTPAHDAVAGGITELLGSIRHSVGHAAASVDSASRLVRGVVAATTVTALDPVFAGAATVGWVTSVGLGEQGRIPVMVRVDRAEGPLDVLVDDGRRAPLDVSPV